LGKQQQRPLGNTRPAATTKPQTVTRIQQQQPPQQEQQPQQHNSDSGYKEYTNNATASVQEEQKQ
jgi:hypothetical protein